MVKENIDRERPTQGGKIGRIVGLSRGMRGNKRETRRKKTYTRKGKWQDSRSFEVKSKFVCKFIFQLCGFIYATFIFKRFD